MTEDSTIRIIRRLLLAILTIGIIGTAADLLLIEHFEDGWQLPPLALFALALVVVAWTALRPVWISLLTLRVVMTLFILAGGAGVLLHYNGNSEFQKEMDPELAGWPLFVKVVTAKSPPALAPGVMVQLGLIGLLYTYRHPALIQPDLSRQEPGATL